MFNKKRQCCCNTPVTGPTFFECFSKIPIASGELSQSGTYSFWVEKDVALTDLTDDFEFYPFQGKNNFIGGVGEGDTTNGKVTWGRLKSEGSNIVFVPSLIPTMTESGTTSLGFLFANSFGAPQALTRRGWHFTSSSRTLTQAQWNALSEHRTVFQMPLVAPFLSSDRQLNDIQTFGMLVGENKFGDSPLLTYTGEKLNWRYEPQLAANVPQTIGFPAIPKQFFDFTHNFPSSITITISGTAPFAYGDGTHTTGVPGVNAPKTANISLSGNIVADKVSTFGSAFGGGPDLKYSVNASSSTAILGSADVQVDDGFGNITTKTVEILNQTTGEFPIKWRGQTALNPSYPLPENSIITCTTDISFQPDLNRLVCEECNPNSNVYSYGDCSPSNYAGSVLGTKNVCGMIDDLKDDEYFEQNTLGMDYPGNEIVSENVPFGFAFRYAPGCSHLITGCDIAPLFTWGKATGSAVSISIEKPSGQGLDSYLETQPQTACSGGVFPPLVDYFFNGPEPPILSGTGTIQLGPFTPQIYLYAT